LRHKISLACFDIVIPAWALYSRLLNIGFCCIAEDTGLKIVFALDVKKFKD
jgi:hypothetical protein